MKRISVLTFLAATLISIGSVCARAQAVVEAQIPFAIHLNGQVLPAGTYRLSRPFVGGLLIQILSRDGRSIAASSSFDVYRKYSGEGVLVFTQYGDQYFLHDVLCNDVGMSIEIPTTKLEKRVRIEMARAAWHQTTVALLRSGEK